MDLHEIRLADQAEPLGPKRQGTLHLDPGLQFVARLIHQVMNGLTAGGVHILREGLLLVDQGALPGAVGPVLEGG